MFDWYYGLFFQFKKKNSLLQVMPVENSMKNPHHFLGCPSVLNITMTIVVSLYTVLGVFGYLKYVEDIKGSITLNIPTEDM